MKIELNGQELEGVISHTDTVTIKPKLKAEISVSFKDGTTKNFEFDNFSYDEESSYFIYTKGEEKLKFYHPKK